MNIQHRHKISLRFFLFLFSILFLFSLLILDDQQISILYVTAQLLGPGGGGSGLFGGSGSGPLLGSEGSSSSSSSSLPPRRSPFISFASSDSYTTLSSNITNLSQIVGNVFQPAGFSSSCNATPAGIDGDICISRLKVCASNYSELGNSATASECPSLFTTCIAEYAACLVGYAPAIAASVNTSICAWSTAITAEVSTAQSSSITTLDCNVFAKHAAKILFSGCQASDSWTSVCAAVASTLSSKGSSLVSSALSRFSLGQTASRPRGMAPLVIRSRGDCSTNNSSDNSSSTGITSCFRPFQGSCSCPNGGIVQRFNGFSPSFLTAATNDSCKYAVSSFEICSFSSDGGTTSESNYLYNISFELSHGTSFSTSSNTNSYDDRLALPESTTTTSSTSASCPISGQTSRIFQILSSDSTTDASSEKELRICAEPNTNVFIVGTDTGGCYEPRDNVSCSCDGKKSGGFSLVFINQSTSKSQSGALVMCAYDISSWATVQQITSSTLSAFSALASGPAYAYLYLASTVTLIDCGKDTSNAESSGGRRVIIPIRFPVDSPADGLYFALTAIFGVLIAQFLVVFVVSVFTFRTGRPVEQDPQSPDQLFFSKHKPRYDPVEYDEVAETNDEEGKESKCEQDQSTNNVRQVRVHCQSSSVFEGLSKVHQSSTLHVSASCDVPECQEENIVDGAKKNENGASDAKKQEEVSSPTMSNDEEEKEGEHYFFVEDENGQTIKLRTPHIVQYKRHPRFRDHFAFQAGKFRLPAVSFIVAKILYQGLSYESVWLLSRYDGSARAVGIVGFVLSILLLLWYCYVGWAAHKLYRTEAYYEYTVGYRSSFALVRFLGFHGMWNRRYKSVRQGSVFFGSFRGDSSHLWWSVPLPVARALLVSIIAAVPVSDGAACSFVYYFLAILLLVTGILQTIVRADRSNIDVITNMFLNIIIAVYLIMIINDADGLNVVYLIIIYAGSALALTSIVFMIHEFGLVLPREMGSYIGDDTDSDVENPEGMSNSVNPLAKEKITNEESEVKEEKDGESSFSESVKQQKMRNEEMRKIRRRQKAAQRQGLDGYFNFCASLWC